MFREANLKIEFGPSDLSTNTPNVGVGMIVRNDIVFEIKADVFRRVYEMGRVDKYILDLGREQNLFCCVIYGYQEDVMRPRSRPKRSLKPSTRKSERTTRTSQQSLKVTLTRHRRNFQQSKK